MRQTITGSLTRYRVYPSMLPVILDPLFPIHLIPLPLDRYRFSIISFGPVQALSWDFVRGLAASPYLWVAITSYGVALASYLVLLTRVPLNVATSIAALNFVAVLLAARIVFGEPIPGLRYIGFGCILIGIYLVSLTQQAPR